MKELSIVVSVYNESGNLQLLVTQITEALANSDISYEIILVNDGSRDNSWEIISNMKKEYNSLIRTINFSRNFGHEAAMIAGIDRSKGKAVVCMDADLQHPPCKIIELFNAYQNGYDLALMVRKSRADNGFKNRISNTFYRFLTRISNVEFVPGASDFFMISHKVVQILKNDFRERNRFIRGYIQWIGFRKAIIEYNAPARMSGKSNYSWTRLIKLSFSAITAFSNKPLSISLSLGVISSIFTLLVGIYSIIMYFIDRPVSGYTTIVLLISFIAAIQFILLGILGKYIGIILDEIKKRPIYIIDEEEKEDRIEK